MAGKLYIVATPIGNMDDITLRAIDILKSVDLIACEDTRHSGVLLKRHGVSSRLVPYHDHNKDYAAPKIVERLSDGLDVALITDSGTPGVSDPAYLLVKLAVEQDLEVLSVPGPSASLAALSISGLPCDRFVFEGFLPAKKGKRKSRLDEIKADPRTIIFYESPHKLLKMLNIVRDVLGNRRCAVARELTKIHEEVLRGTLTDMIEHFTTTNPRGEFVVIVEGNRDGK